MEQTLKIGDIYSLDLIETMGFIKKVQTKAVVYFRKGSTLMVFDIPKPQEPRKFKLVSILTD